MNALISLQMSGSFFSGTGYLPIFEDIRWVGKTCWQIVLIWNYEELDYFEDVVAVLEPDIMHMV
jgi:hypothetical protein